MYSREPRGEELGAFRLDEKFKESFTTKETSGEGPGETDGFGYRGERDRKTIVRKE